MKKNQEKFNFIKEAISTNRVVLFMKGTKDQPLCGFSSRVVDILDELNIPFKDINILEDDDLRQAIKDYTNWPTLPQLYIDGAFIGGCDIVTELHKEGKFKTPAFKNGKP